MRQTATRRAGRMGGRRRGGRAAVVECERETRQSERRQLCTPGMTSLVSWTGRAACASAAGRPWARRDGERAAQAIVPSRLMRRAGVRRGLKHMCRHEMQSIILPPRPSRRVGTQTDAPAPGPRWSSAGTTLILVSAVGCPAWTSTHNKCVRGSFRQCTCCSCVVFAVVRVP